MSLENSYIRGSYTVNNNVFADGPRKYVTSYQSNNNVINFKLLQSDLVTAQTSFEKQKSLFFTESSDSRLKENFIKDFEIAVDRIFNGLFVGTSRFSRAELAICRAQYKCGINETIIDINLTNVYTPIETIVNLHEQFMCRFSNLETLLSEIIKNFERSEDAAVNRKNKTPYDIYRKSLQCMLIKKSLKSTALELKVELAITIAKLENRLSDDRSKSGYLWVSLEEELDQLNSSMYSLEDSIELLVYCKGNFPRHIRNIAVWGSLVGYAIPENSHNVVTVLEYDISKKYGDNKLVVNVKYNDSVTCLQKNNAEIREKRIISNNSFNLFNHVKINSLLASKCKLINASLESNMKSIKDALDRLKVSDLARDGFQTKLAKAKKNRVKVEDKYVYSPGYTQKSVTEYEVGVAEHKGDMQQIAIEIEEHMLNITSAEKAVVDIWVLDNTKYLAGLLKSKFATYSVTLECKY
jgi:hypothetical protein